MAKIFMVIDGFVKGPFYRLNLEIFQKISECAPLLVSLNSSLD